MKLIFLQFVLLYILGVSATSWWKNTVLYEVYISSFKDSDGDGIGDLNGITEKLYHFVDLNIETLHLSPFFKSPMVDMGYDISNFTDVDPKFGTLQDFDRLVAAAKERGIKIIGDLVINHSSDEHPWFQKSIDRIDPYTDYYVWVDPKGYDVNGKPLPPNNWVSVFEGSLWEWNEKRMQFYLHQFAVKQPDLNLRNGLLKKELEKVMEFWFERGMQGFRLDAVGSYMEDEFLRDEPLIDSTKSGLHRTDYQHIYTQNLWESYQYVHEIRLYVEEYNKNHPNQLERIIFSEWYADLNLTLAYYGTNDYPMAHFPFNFAFVTFKEVVPAKNYNEFITSWLDNMPEGATANWMSENHDVGRVSKRLGEEYKDIITLTIMTLPGVACIYYGQEIGMTFYTVRSDQRQDLNLDNFSGKPRDCDRLPMQWDSSLNAGFSSNREIWLPVHPNYWSLNVKFQKATKNSRYNMFKILAKLKKSKTMKHGNFTSHILSKWVYSYVRSCKNCKPYIIILNLGTEIEMFDLHDAIPNLPATLKVVTSSENAGYRQGEIITSASKFPRIFTIRSTSGVVLTDGKPNNEDWYDE